MRKDFDFLHCNPTVSGRGGTVLCTVLNMPQECNWITSVVDVDSEGSCTSYIHSVDATVIDNLLASVQTVRTVFLKVVDCTGLLGVAMEGIYGGDVGTRHWMCKQRATAVGEAEKRKNNENFGQQLALHQDTKPSLNGV